jgi:hypothetical protein
MARSAAGTIAGAACASVVLDESLGALTMAAAGEAAARLHRVQLSADRGPCLEALWGGHEVVLHALPSENWPEFGEAALREGICSSLSMPMAGEGRRGVVSVYGRRPGLFGDPSVLEQARSFVRYCGVILAARHRCAQADEQCAHLRQALESRAIIERAKGMIMGQARYSADEAFAVLARASKRSHVKLRDIAFSVVTDADEPGG